MDKLQRVAERVLDYWYTIEFLEQEKFPVYGEDAMKAIKEAKNGKSNRKTLSHFLLFDNTTIDSLYTTIFSEAERCGMKYWSNFTFYIGKVKREMCIQSIANAMNYEGDRPEKNNDEIAWASFQLAYDGRYLEHTLSLSTIVWALKQISNEQIKISSALSVEKYKREIDEIEKEIFKKDNFFVQDEEEMIPFSEAKVPISDIKQLTVTILEKYLNKYVKAMDDEAAYKTVYAVSFDMYKDEITKSRAGEDNYFGLSHNFFLQDIGYIADLVSERALETKGMDMALMEYITEGYVRKYKDFPRIDLINPENGKEFQKQVYNIIDIRNAPLGKWPSKYSPAFMQQVAINFQADRRNKEYKVNGNIFSVNGPPGTGKTTLLKEIIVHNIVERAKLLAKYENPDDAFVKHDFLYGGKEGKTYSKYISSWYSLADDEINNYSMLVTSCNNTAVENISKELPRGKDIFESLQPDKDDPEEYKIALKDIERLFEVEKGGVIENTKNGEQFEDIYFTKYAKTMLNDNSAWGMIAVPLGKKVNIEHFYKCALSPILFDDFYWDKSNAVKRHERYLEVRKKFLKQLECVENIEKQIGELCEAVNRYQKANCNYENTNQKHTESILEIKDEISEIDKRIKDNCSLYFYMVEEVNSKKKLAEKSKEEFEKKEKEYNEIDNKINDYQQDKNKAIKNKSFFIKIFNKKKYQKIVDDIKQLEKMEKEFSEKLKEASKEKYSAERIMINSESALQSATGRLNKQKSLLESDKKLKYKLQTKIENLSMEITKTKNACIQSKKKLEQLTDEFRKKDFMDIPNIINDEYIMNLVSEDKDKSTKAQVYNPWTSKRYDCERIKLFNYALCMNKEFVLSTNKCRDNFKILAQYWGLLFGDDKERIKFHCSDRENFVAALYQTLFLLTPVISSTFASVGTMFRDVKQKGVIGTLIIDEAGQAQPQMAVGALIRSKKAIIVGDPKQVEPVVTDDLKLLKKIFDDEIVRPYSSDKTLSVQGFADSINIFGTYLNNPGQDEDTWVGCPLVVHRRCISPMYDISNEISYNGIMKQQTRKPKGALEMNFIYKKSQWIDVKGKEEGKKRHFVVEQGMKVCEMLEIAFEKEQCPNVYIISPFTTVVSGIKKMIKNHFANKEDMPEKLEEWIENNIGTVHKFQGKEANEVIFLLGCDASKDAKGAISWVNTNIVNVAATRAKYRLYIIGDSVAWEASTCVSRAKQIIEFIEGELYMLNN